jgi:flagellar biosynthesis GTPase FlhF
MKIFKKYNKDILFEHYINKTLKTLPGIGKKIEQDINNYFNIIENRENNKIEEILINYPYLNIDNKIIEKLQENEIEIIYKNYEWIKNVQLRDNIKERLIKKILTEENNGKPNWKRTELSLIEDDPMLLNDEMNIKDIDYYSLLNNWWNKDSIYRHDCWLEYLINDICRTDGNTYITKGDIDTWINSKSIEPKLNDNIIIKQLVRLCNDGILINYGNYYILKKIYDMEEFIINSINELKSEKLQDLPNLTIDDFEPDDNGNKLTNEQINAINGIINKRISILTGPGGSGKTNKVVKNLCDYLEKTSEYISIFTAPTHAAKKQGQNCLKNNKYIMFDVLASYTYSYNSSVEGWTNRLIKLLISENIKYIFIDEMSMVNIEVFYEFLKIIMYFKNTDEFIQYDYSNTDDNGNYNKIIVEKDYDLHIVLIGDKNQLEPIGIGDPFLRLLNYIPTYELTKNFRSKPEIKEFCNIILNKSKYGEFWSMTGNKNNIIKNNYKDIDFLFTKNWESELKILLNKLKEEGIVPCDNIESIKNSFQCIAYKNDICKRVCPIIRKIFKNNNSEEIYEVGDIVVLSKNVRPYFYNTDIGEIIGKNNDYTYKIRLINPHDIKEEFKYNDKQTKETIIFENLNIVKLTDRYFKPNYCRTVHSSQGLQYPIVIYILDSSYSNIRLNYTAYSRAQDKLYLLGDITGFNGNRARKPENDKTTLMKFLSDNKNTVEIIMNSINTKYTSISDNIILNNSKSISKKTRYDLWNKYYQSKNKGKCKICKEKILINNFECGHKKSLKNGGTNNINNLKPICKKCNLNIGENNMKIYKNNLINNKL